MGTYANNFERAPWVLCDDFVNLPLDQPPFADIRGYTIDIENVLTDGIDGDDPTVRPEAMVKLQEMDDLGLGMVLATNCKDPDFVEAVSAQVNGLRPDPIEALTSVQVGKSKTHAEPFLWAANHLRLSSRHMAHIDDQVKSHIGAVRAGFGMRIWPMPWGEHEHPGVAKFRPAEMKVARNLVRLLPRTLILE